MTPALRCEDLTHWYGATCAVDHLGLSVEPGTVYALLGRNGSGKSTVVRMLLGMLPPSYGRAEVLGVDSDRLDPRTRARIGYVSEGHALLDEMRVADHIRLAASCHKDWDQDEVQATIARFRIRPRQRARELSRGQRAVFALALALAPKPELLILDDPTLGLDAVARHEFLEQVIAKLSSEGRTVFFASHRLEDVERLADRIGILDQGALLVDAPVEAFRSRVKRVRTEFADPPARPPQVPRLLRARAQRDGWVLAMLDPDAETLESLRAAGARHVEVLDLNLEEAFVDYTAELPRPSVEGGRP